MGLYEDALKLPADRDDFGPCNHEWKLVKRVEAISADGRTSEIFVRRMRARLRAIAGGSFGEILFGNRRVSDQGPLSSRPAAG